MNLETLEGIAEHIRSQGYDFVVSSVDVEQQTDCHTVDTIYGSSYSVAGRTETDVIIKLSLVVPCEENDQDRYDRAMSLFQKR